MYISTLESMPVRIAELCNVPTLESMPVRIAELCMYQHWSQCLLE